MHLALYLGIFKYLGNTTVFISYYYYVFEKVSLPHFIDEETEVLIEFQ